MTPLDLLFLSFPVVTILTWGYVVERARARWQRYRDRRSYREAVWSLLLFIAALSAAVSLLLALLVDSGFDPGQNIRRVVFGVAWGSFCATGIYLAVEEHRGGTNHTGRHDE